MQIFAVHFKYLELHHGLTLNFVHVTLRDLKEFSCDTNSAFLPGLTYSEVLNLSMKVFILLTFGRFFANFYDVLTYCSLLWPKEIRKRFSRIKPEYIYKNLNQYY